MGFDKATLVIDGEPLWQRQIRLLQCVGANEVFISGPADGPWKDSGLPVLEDEVPQLGPMGALVGILKKISTPRVLVLAVDMPAMTAAFLQKLTTANRAIVPKNGDYFEPLAAVYAATDWERLATYLQRGDRSLQPYLRESAALGSVQVLELSESEKPLFMNVNALAGLPGGQLRNVCKTADESKDRTTAASDYSARDNASE